MKFRKSDSDKKSREFELKMEKRLRNFDWEIEQLKFQQAQAYFQIRKRNAPLNFRESEYKVFSQWGQDGIIQHLVDCLPSGPDTFIEFGVQDYRESNTRFLLLNNNWKGLIFDGSNTYVDSIKKDRIYWRYDLTAKQAFITCENIDSLIREEGWTGEIGLLSVDIDGNDYYVWKAIECIKPRILVLEYNARLGAQASVSIPYSADFERSAAHWSCLYFGASLAALTKLSREKGYALVGCNRHGNDAFFVREDLISDVLPECSVAEAFVRNKSRESRDCKGRLSYLSAQEENQILSGLEWVEV